MIRSLCLLSLLVAAASAASAPPRIYYKLRPVGKIATCVPDQSCVEFEGKQFQVTKLNAKTDNYELTAVSTDPKKPIFLVKAEIAGRTRAALFQDQRADEWMDMVGYDPTPLDPEPTPTEIESAVKLIRSEELKAHVTTPHEGLLIKTARRLMLSKDRRRVAGEDVARLTKENVFPPSIEAKVRSLKFVMNACAGLVKRRPLMRQSETQCEFEIKQMTARQLARLGRTLKVDLSAPETMGVQLPAAARAIK